MKIPVFLYTQFNSTKNTQSDFPAGLNGLVQAIQGIMIGESQQLDAAGFGAPHDLCGAILPV